MSEPKTIKVKDGGFVSVERGPDGKGWTRLEVATADRTVALSCRRTRRSRSVFSCYGWRAVRSRTGRPGPGARPGGFGLRRPLEVPAGRGDAEAGPTLTIPRASVTAAEAVRHRRGRRAARGGTRGRRPLSGSWSSSRPGDRQRSVALPLTGGRRGGFLAWCAARGLGLDLPGPSDADLQGFEGAAG